MDLKSERLRFIFGIKLRKYRERKGYSLKKLSEITGLSSSYLNEMENGKKYPKPEKIIEISKALEVSFDSLVTLNIDKDLIDLVKIIDSPIIQSFPFKAFGINHKDLIDITSPGKFSALIGTLIGIAKNYDMRVEYFFLAALRSYQEMHNNYFQSLEDKAIEFLTSKNIDPLKEELNLDFFKNVLLKDFNYEIIELNFNNYPELSDLRTVYIKGKPNKIIINEKLNDAQKAFVLGREIGYCYLNLKERANTSSWLKVTSFDQVLNHFQASYFSGAIIINKDKLSNDMSEFFNLETWQPEAFLNIMKKYQATSETFMYRLSEILPYAFDLKEIHFLRFFNTIDTEHYILNKELNMSRIIIPQGIGLNEHYCRRWMSIKLLNKLSGSKDKLVIDAQYSNFLADNSEFFCITVANPIPLVDKSNMSLTLGFNVTDNLKKTVKFLNDPQITKDFINETCQRCSLSYEECVLRASPPSTYLKEKKSIEKNIALENLIKEFK